MGLKQYWYQRQLRTTSIRPEVWSLIPRLQLVVDDSKAAFIHHRLSITEDTIDSDEIFAKATGGLCQSWRFCRWPWRPCPRNLDWQGGHHLFPQTSCPRNLDWHGLTIHLYGMCSNVQNRHSTPEKKLEYLATAILRTAAINSVQNVAKEVLRVENGLAIISVENQGTPAAKLGTGSWPEEAKLASHRQRCEIAANIAHPLNVLQSVASSQLT